MELIPLFLFDPVRVQSSVRTWSILFLLLLILSFFSDEIGCVLGPEFFVLRQIR